MILLTQEELNTIIGDVQSKIERLQTKLAEKYKEENSVTNIIDEYCEKREKLLVYLRTKIEKKE
jgi:hypothetical protein